MNTEFHMLILTAVSIGFIHTLLGPDHYIPFIAMSRSGGWSFQKTARVTALCGLGHVFGSVVIGLMGVMFGVALNRLEWIESLRGEIAGWLLLSFGFLYTIWGFKEAFQQKGHTHEADVKRSMTPWILFTIFIFGPCEPLIPILMYPALKASFMDMAWVILAFGSATIFTMLSVVFLTVMGVSFVRFERLERFSHAFAGLVVFMCGIGISLLGL